MRDVSLDVPTKHIAPVIANPVRRIDGTARRVQDNVQSLRFVQPVEGAHVRLHVLMHNRHMRRLDFKEARMAKHDVAPRLSFEALKRFK